jgi:hypothetical protein
MIIYIWVQRFRVQGSKVQGSEVPAFAFQATADRQDYKFMVEITLIVEQGTRNRAI